MSDTAPAGKRPLKIALSIVAALVVVGVAVYFGGNATRYNKALALEESGQYGEAYGLYAELGGFRDADQRLATLDASYPALRFSTVEQDDFVTLGTFEQDGRADNGAEPITWIVLDEIDGRYLLISEECLTCMPYHDEPGNITWEDCSLRLWLNGAFYEEAFTDEERGIIALSENENADDDFHHTDGGNDTFDHVFLLSKAEAQAHLGTEDKRWMNGQAQATPVAEGQGAHVSGINGKCPWWLRSPGAYQDSALFVEFDGSVNTNGAVCSNDYYCSVRPAIWVDVDA